jgi:chitinase
MKRRSVLALALLLPVGVTAGGVATARVRTVKPPKYWVTGYHVGYQRDLWPAASVDFKNVTHMVVGRVKPLADGSVATDFDIDPERGPIFAQEIAKRTRAAGKTPLLMIGGAGEHDAFASAISEQNLDRFVKELLALATKWDYAGFELDFEPIQPADEPRLEAFARALRAAKPGLVLTLPVGWVNTNTDAISPFHVRIATLVDQMNIMSYSMSGPWGWPTWHSSPLFGDNTKTPASISSSVAAYLAAGVPSRKLGVGSGFYGQCWQKRTGPNQEQGDGVLFAEDWQVSSAIIAADYEPNMTKSWDDVAKVPYLSSETPVGKLGCQYISYENEQSLKEKAAYIKQNQLGGLITWTSGQGYEAPSKKNPMMRSAWESLNG